MASPAAAVKTFPLLPPKKSVKMRTVVLYPTFRTSLGDVSHFGIPLEVH
jgi:hypothetical protein